MLGDAENVNLRSITVSRWSGVVGCGDGGGVRSRHAFACAVFGAVKTGSEFSELGRKRLRQTGFISS